MHRLSASFLRPSVKQASSTNLRAPARLSFTSKSKFQTGFQPSRPSALEPFQAQPMPTSPHALLLFSLEFDVSGTGFTILEGKDGSIYSGETVQYNRQGKGSCTYVDGATYEGEWREGKKHGFGVMNFATEGRYEGTWKEDHPNGNGVFVSAQGIRYEGDWAGRDITGKFKVNYTDGSAYHGELRHGRHHGYGVRVYRDESRYEGSWRNGLRDGNGTMFYRCGLVYSGKWAQGSWNHQMSDLGTKPARLLRPEVGSYEGEVLNGELTGKGTMRYVDGRVYEGQWKDGAWEGEVKKLSWPQVGTFSGVARDGVLIRGTFSFRDGTSWKGSIESAHFHVPELAPLLFQDGVLPGRKSSSDSVNSSPKTVVTKRTVVILEEDNGREEVGSGVSILLRLLAGHLAKASQA